MRRILICGDRNWDNQERVTRILEMWMENEGVEVVIEGEARGADTQGREAAWTLGVPVIGFRANWDELGKAAGHIRNTAMLNQGQPDLVLAFHDHIEQSRGTRNMLRQAMKKGIECRLYTSTGERELILKEDYAEAAKNAEKLEEGA